MGSIASVLQWHCTSCALINPSEKRNCMRCGYTRRNREINRISENKAVHNQNFLECKIKNSENNNNIIINENTVDKTLTLSYNELPNTCIQNR